MQSCSPKGPRMIGEGGRDSGTHREREAQKTESGHLGEIQLSQGRHGYLRNIYQAISPQGDTIASEPGCRLKRPGRWASASPCEVPKSTPGASEVHFVF